MTGWIITASIGVAILSLLALPAVLIYLPADYFVRRHRQPWAWTGVSSITRIALILLKNLVGAVLVIAGVIMLVTPGQGLLCILFGILMLDFPGKQRVEQRILANERVQRGINRIREKAGRAPLEIPSDCRPQADK